MRRRDSENELLEYLGNTSMGYFKFLVLQQKVNEGHSFKEALSELQDIECELTLQLMYKGMSKQEALEEIDFNDF